VHDEVKIKTKSSKPMIRYALFVFGCMLYNMWQFFKKRLQFRRCVNIIERNSIIKAAVLSTVEIMNDKSLLRNTNRPPDKIYEKVIEKFGYRKGISL
jgi:hypothetical protein